MKFDLSELYISHVTGQIGCTNGFLLAGNAQGIAVPSLIPIGILPNLTLNKTWVGDSGNRPIEKPYIGDTTFLLRLPSALLPSAQDLNTLSLAGGGLIKVGFNGYIELAIPLLDYAPEAYAVPLVIAAGIEVTAAAISATAALASAGAAAASAANAILSANTAATAQSAATTQRQSAQSSATNTAGYYSLLLGVTLNQLPNYGDIDLHGYRLKNVNPQPADNNDLITFDFLWALLNGRVVITS